MTDLAIQHQEDAFHYAEAARNTRDAIHIIEAGGGVAYADPYRASVLDSQQKAAQAWEAQARARGLLA